MNAPNHEVRSTVNVTSLLMGFMLAVTGCAGRDADPILVNRSTDHALTCSQIRNEMEANERKASNIAGEKSDALGQNVAAGVVGAVLFWPALFFLDLGEAEKTEMRALKTRNEHLGDLKSYKGCR